MAVTAKKFETGKAFNLQIGCEMDNKYQNYVTG